MSSGTLATTLSDSKLWQNKWINWNNIEATYPRVLGTAALYHTISGTAVAGIYYTEQLLAAYYTTNQTGLLLAMLCIADKVTKFFQVVKVCYK